MRDVILFDLDGVIFKTPSETIHDEMYWERFWADHENVEGYKSMVRFLRLLYEETPSLHVLFCTSRPVRHYRNTIESLAMVGALFSGEPKPPLLESDTLDKVMLWGRASIVMQDSIDHSDWSGSGPWKASIARQINTNRSLNLILAIEDHKPIADVLRKEVPVLLFERQK